MAQWAGKERSAVLPYVGAALAGDALCRADLDQLVGNDQVDPDLRDVVTQTVPELEDADSFAHILDFIGRVAEAIRATDDGP